MLTSKSRAPVPTFQATITAFAGITGRRFSLSHAETGFCRWRFADACFLHSRSNGESPEV